MSGCFQLRLGVRRCVPALFQPSLRLRSTFSARRPETEANESILHELPETDSQACPEPSFSSKVHHVQNGQRKLSNNFFKTNLA
jgi:hypothetical protein